MRSMKPMLLVLLLAAAAALAIAVHVPVPAATAAAPAATPAAKAAGDGAAVWPATREGLLAHAWADSFSSGEKAMHAFAAANMSKEALAKKGLDARMTSYRDLHERLGELTLDAVVRAQAGVLVVRLLDANAAPHEFTFTVETKEPWKLVSVTMLDHQMRMHPGLEWLHH